MIKKIAKKVLPKDIKIKLKSIEAERIKKQTQKLPKIDVGKFISIITSDLKIQSGDLVFIHSSMDKINLDFPFYRIIPIMTDIVGPEGTILFPTYPEKNSYETLKEKKKFNVKKTPSYTGILNEFARRQKNSVRSLHPTKSVCAIGRLAKEMTSEHHKSIYPYDICSPYYKLKEYDGKVIGIGVKSTYLSAVHAVDDYLKEAYPVYPYHKEVFEVECINYEGKKEIVQTLAHDMRKMDFDLPGFFAKYLSQDICEDLNVNGADFFVAQARPLLDKLVNIAEKEGITIYKKKYYK